MSAATTSVGQGAKVQHATAADIDKIRALVKETKFCMLTTLDEHGALRSRPMGMSGDLETVGDVSAITFFTYKDSAKCSEMKRTGCQLNLAFSDPKQMNFVSVSGHGTVIEDRAEMEKRWSPTLKAWFPNGLDTPGCSLLKVTIDRAEYWESPSSGVSHVISFLKGKVTGEIGGGGQHKAVEMGAAGGQKKTEAKLDTK